VGDLEVKVQPVPASAAWSEDRQQAEVGDLHIEERDPKPFRGRWLAPIDRQSAHNDRDHLRHMEEYCNTGHDIWVIRDQEKEILFPAVEDVILSVNKIQREIRVRDLYDLAEGDDC
jgi:hypothetical protein